MEMWWETIDADKMMMKGAKHGNGDDDHHHGQQPTNWQSTYDNTLKSMFVTTLLAAEYCPMDMR